MAVAAVVLVIALGALVATDAHGASALAWVGAGVAGLLVALGPWARSTTPVHAGVALLGAALLLRHDARLALAPLYGAGLLMVSELGTRAIELREVRAVGPRVVSTRAATALAMAALGACGAAAAAVAVTVAAGRSVWFTAIGAIAAVGMFVAISLIARRIRGRAGVGNGSDTASEEPPPTWAPSTKSAPGGRRFD
jgi:hypothetical protein